MGMAIGFNQYLTHGPLTSDRYVMESQGMTRERIGRGDIMFIDQDGVVWTATSWEFFPRYLEGDTENENPAFLKAVGEVDVVVGSVKQDKSKGILRVNIRDGKNNDMQVGKFATKAEEPSKIDNSDMSNLGYKRVTRKGGQFQTLSANAFLEGQTVKIVRQTPHYVFTSLDSLRNRIISNMKNSKFPMLRQEPLIKATEKFLDEGAIKFDWSMVGELMPMEDRRKFGIYLVSELCYPFWIWSGRNINNFPGFSHVRFFLVPKDSDNAGYDSYIVGNLVGGGLGKVVVSSKAPSGGGKGARSSILPKLNSMANTMQSYGELNNKFLQLLLPYFKSTATGSRSIYPFMVRDVLRMSSIKDPVDLWRRVCVLHGKRSGKLSDAEMKLTEDEVQAIQKKVQGGITLPAIGIKAPLNPNASRYPLPTQWKEFSKYLSDVFCEAIAVGLNHDGASDLRPTAVWQIDLKNDIFVNEGTVHFAVKEGGSNVKKVIVDTGKQSAGDPSRNITWLGMRPL
jgi:hypothetical protein